MKYCLSARSITLLGLLVSGTGLAQVSPQSKFFPITPCRVADTRITPNGANAGPALVANAGRAFPIVGTCGIPATARAVVLNVTAVNATADGDLRHLPDRNRGAAGRDRDQLPRREDAREQLRRPARDDRRHRRLAEQADAARCTSSSTSTGYFEDPPAAPASHATSRSRTSTTFGATPQLVAHLRDVGINGWLNEQFAIPPNYYPSMPLQPNTIPGACTGTCQRDNYTMYPLQKQFFYNALYLPDQLRQRMAWALHKFLVISGQQEIQPSHMVPYLNTLVSERVRELPGHPLPAHAEPRDGRLPQHEDVDPPEPERELRARDPAALLDRARPAEHRRDAEARRRRQHDPDVHAVRHQRVLARLHGLAARRPAGPGHGRLHQDDGRSSTRTTTRDPRSVFCDWYGSRRCRSTVRRSSPRTRRRHRRHRRRST